MEPLETEGRPIRKAYTVQARVNEGNNNRDKGEITEFKKWMNGFLIFDWGKGNLRISSYYWVSTSKNCKMNSLNEEWKLTNYSR